MIHLIPKNDSWRSLNITTALSSQKLISSIADQEKFLAPNKKAFPELKVASLFDYELIREAKEEAEKFLEKNEDLSDFPILKKTY